MVRTGMVIAERYEILQKIGTGGMADVFKAKDHKLNRCVAVKVLKAEFREDPAFIRKFKSEAQAAAGLTHPNVVNVFDVGDDEGVSYIVMELIEGITLKEYISKKGRLSTKEATSIAIQVSMGLEAAHSHGIVHRDVKPQNIIISTDGKVKVTDFGIARAASSNTISSNVMGSVHYSSPEQVRGGYSDEKSDIYSLGITLYEMVAGKVPFDGDTTVAIAIKHLQEEMISPSTYAEELPYSLEQIIYKCTQKSIDRRYSKMEDVIADLKHSLIDPQGDFVKLNVVDSVSPTKVISEEELGEIKQAPKIASKQEALELMKQLSEAEEEYENRKKDRLEKKTRTASAKESRQTKEPRQTKEARDTKASKNKKESKDTKSKSSGKIKRKHRAVSRVFVILAFLIGTGLLCGAVYHLGKITGLIGEKEPDVQVVEQPQEPKDDGMTVVPDIVGKSETEARDIANAANLGIQMMGDQISPYEKGKIAAQDIPAGNRVEKYTTLKYYVSKGAQEYQIPETYGQTGIAIQKLFETAGLKVDVQKEYSELDSDGYPMVEPGYVLYTSPASGEMVKTGDTVTLVVSRGTNYYGDAVEMPNVVGMNQEDALTTLGKFINVKIQNTSDPGYPDGEVMIQVPEAYSYADPDGEVILTVNSTAGASDMNGSSASAAETQNTEQEAPVVTGNGVMKCTQALESPNGYNGGKVRLELLQTVNGQPTSTVVLEGEKIQFPYPLDLTGAPGITEGVLYIYEKKDGEYTGLGNYNITFHEVM